MRNDLNRFQAIGHVGSAPEMRTMPNGKSVVNFSVATTTQWVNTETGEEKEKTEWHRCSAFGKLAEVITQHVGKGKQLYIEGKLQYNEFTDKNGVKHDGSQIVLESFQFVGKKDKE